MDVLVENRHENGTYDSTSSNTESDGKKPNSSITERSSVASVSLDDPEDNTRNVVDTGAETENKNSDEHLLVLCQCHWKHRVRGEKLPNSPCSQESKTDGQSSNNMLIAPVVIYASPVDTDQEDGYTRSGQDGSKIINTTQKLSFGQANAINTWWWLVEDRQNNQSTQRPTSDEDRDPTPAVLSKELTVQRGWCERKETHDDVANGDTTSICWYKLSDGSDGGKKLNTDSDTT